MAGHQDDKQSLDVGPAFLWAVILNTTYLVVEALFGFWIGSLALLADAAHNLTDVFGLLIAWGAAVPAVKQALDRAGWKAADIERIEINEAFAAIAIAVTNDLSLNADVVNVEGGAIRIREMTSS